MDVLINYGITFKKCNKQSYSGYNHKTLLSYLSKNIIEKNNETSMALVAELHCSSYYKDIDNIIIQLFSQYFIFHNITFAYFIDKYFYKIHDIKKTIPKSQHNNALINSNEIRNIYCTIFSNFLHSQSKQINTKLETKCHLPEFYLQHSNVNTYHNIFDNNNNQLSPLLSKGIQKKNINVIEKIIYWIFWCYKIESLEKKINKQKYSFLSKYKSLKNIKHNNLWEFFIWHKIWQKNEKNNFLNKSLLKSLNNLFFHNYSHSKLKERAPILAISILLSNSNSHIHISRNINKNEIFTCINSNKFYKNIQLEENNDENYLQIYNNYHNIHQKDSELNKKIYKKNKMDIKMNFLKNYNPSINKNKNILEYIK